MPTCHGVGKLFTKEGKQAMFFSVTHDEEGKQIGKVTEGNQPARTLFGVEIDEEKPVLLTARAALCHTAYTPRSSDGSERLPSKE